jgi:hypothetical protein
MNAPKIIPGFDKLILIVTGPENFVKKKIGNIKVILDPDLPVFLKGQST